LQLKIRFKDNQLPTNGPLFFSASNVYCEQLGSYLQVDGVYGEIAN